MKKTVFLFLIVLVSCKPSQNALVSDEQQVNSTLDAWHKAAAEAKLDAYFGFMSADAIFIGTDATENWNKAAFQVFAKPYFDKGKAWNFTAFERHINFDTSRKTAWFDELLDTQMRICRGSGVLVKTGKQWEIKHYVLSMTIPNEYTDEVVKIKAPVEDSIIKNRKSK